MAKKKVAAGRVVIEPNTLDWGAGGSGTKYLIAALERAGDLLFWSKPLRAFPDAQRCENFTAAAMETDAFATLFAMSPPSEDVQVEWSNPTIFPDGVACGDMRDTSGHALGLRVVGDARETLADVLGSEHSAPAECWFPDEQKFTPSHLDQFNLAAEVSGALGPSERAKLCVRIKKEQQAIAALARRQKNREPSADRGHHRSHESGEARAKLIAALTAHHQYESGSVLNTEPIGCNELSVMAGVRSNSTSSRFFKAEFGSHTAYKRACRDTAKLANCLKIFNGEIVPKLLLNHDPVDPRSVGDE
jgi:hypothetical protein